MSKVKQPPEPRDEWPSAVEAAPYGGLIGVFVGKPGEATKFVPVREVEITVGNVTLCPCATCGILAGKHAPCPFCALGM